MLAKTLRLERLFARRIIHSNTIGKPYFTNKSQVELDKYIRDYEDKPQRLHPKSKINLVQKTQELEPLKYKLHLLPEDVKRLDTAAPLGVSQEIPWRIIRTKSENLPVYRRYTHGRTQNYTEIRLIEGDINVSCDSSRTFVQN